MERTYTPARLLTHGENQKPAPTSFTSNLAGYYPACDATKEYRKPEMVLFRQPPSVFSNCGPLFDSPSTAFPTRAWSSFLSPKRLPLFGDSRTLARILRVSDPKLRKPYGREIHSFDVALWERERKTIVVVGCYKNKGQNPGTLQHLLGTGNKLLVEASSYDTVWVIV